MQIPDSICDCLGHYPLSLSLTLITKSISHEMNFFTDKNCCLKIIRLMTIMIG